MIDLSRAGALSGIIKFGKVLLWVAVAGAITALINYFQTLDFGEWVVVQGIINALLAGIAKWITTKQ